MLSCCLLYFTGVIDLCELFWSLVSSLLLLNSCRMLLLFSSFPRILANLGWNLPIFPMSNYSIESKGLFGKSGSNPPWIYKLLSILTIVWRYLLIALNLYQSELSVSYISIFAASYSEALERPPITIIRGPIKLIQCY